MLTKNTPKRSNERRAKLDADPTVSSTKNFVVELGNDLQTSIKDGSMANTSHLLDRLCDLVITAKHTEKDLDFLLGCVGTLPFSTLSSSDVLTIAKFITKYASVESSAAPNVVKCGELANVFILFMLEIFDKFQERTNCESTTDIDTIILRGISVTLKSGAPILVTFKQKTLANLLLLHSTLSQTTAGASPALLDALKAAYLLPHQGTVKGNSQTSTALNANFQLFDSMYPVLLAETPTDLNIRVVEVLIQHLHSSYNYLSKLPPAAPVTAEGLESSVLVCNNATAQLKLLISALSALHGIFEQANSTGTAKNSTLVIPPQYSYLGLVLSIDKLLRNVMPTLSKKLTIIAEAAAAYQTAHMPAQRGPPAVAMSEAASLTPQASAIGVKSSIKAAYRPPSQRDVLIAGATSRATSNSNISAAGDFLGQYTANFATLKVQVSQIVLAFLGALAAHSPSVFLQSWPLFLTDTMPAEAHVESQCQEIIRSVMGGSAASSTPRIVSSTPRIVTSSTRTPSAQSLAPAPAAAKGGLTNKTPSVKLTSPILGTMLHSATVAVRAAAVGALVKVLSGLQLRTYFATTRPGAIGRIDTRSSSTSRVTSAGSALFSPGGGVSGSSGVRGLIGQGNKEASAISKQLKTLFKIIQVVIVMLQTEPRDEVLELLLKLASLLLNHMPLSDYWKNRKVVRTGGIIMSNDANSVYERYAVVMYHLILKIALRYELPSLAASFPTEQAAATGGDSATTSRAVPVSVTASYMAMCWVTERCKQLDQSQAFTLALQMTYLPVARPTGVAGDGVGAGPPPGIATAAGMLRSGVVGGVAGVGGGGSGGGQSFIHAAVHCLLRAFPPHVTNNLYCITVRTLCSALAQYHPALFLSDPRWLCSLLNKLESHSLPALRLQGSKMLASLFEHDLKNKLAQLGTASAAESKLYGFLPPQGDYLTDDEMLNNSCFATTYEACEVVGRSLKANVAAMLGACTDDAHIVRTQAMLALTSLGAYTWRVLHNIASSPKQLALIASSFPAFGASFLPEIISMRVVLMRVLLIGTVDVIGTVRASAFKSIGDCVVHNALLLSVTPRPGRNVRRDGSTASTHPLLTSIEECYMEDLFRALAVGIVDTKLAVRIQAAWALGNVLINLLPYRWEHLSRTVDCVPSSLAPTSSHSWLSDACWLSLYRDLLPLLRDSDKVLATAVCCIGSVIAGMRPEYAQSHRECLVNLHTSLIQEFLVPEFGLLLDGESEGAFNWRVFSNIKTPISEQSQKLSFALSQSLGFILHSFVHSWEDNAGGAPLPQARYVRDIMEVQIHFLKYSKLKVQLQAVQTLVYAAAKHNALDVLSCDYSGQLVRLLECLFVISSSLAPIVENRSVQHFSPTIAPPTMRVSSPLPVPPAGLQENSSIAAVPSAAATCTATGSASGTAGAAIEHTAAAGTAVVAGAVAGVAEEETREEVVQLMRSRATQLVHYSILLLHTVLAQLARQAGISSSGDGGSDSDKQDIHRAVIELLLYYGDNVASWLEAQHGAVSSSSNNKAPISHSSSGNSAAPCFAYSAANTSAGLPHVQYDVCGALGCQGKTPQTLVAEVSVTLLQFASFQPMNINPSADTPLSYAVEKLPASVTSGLARIAQYAPEALRDSLNSAVFSGTDLSLGGGAGGGYSYGVFDGLAPQPYLYSLPVLHSPPHSPGKVISQRGNYTSPESRNAGGGGLSNTVSPNLGYAVQSVDDDEDEF